MADDAHTDRPTGPQGAGPRTSRSADFRETRGATFVASMVVIASQAWLAPRLLAAWAWPLVAVSAVLLLCSVAVYWFDLEEPGKVARGFASGVVGTLALANIIYLVLLVQEIFVTGSPDPIGLLISGLVLWTANVATFALTYWEVDGGGPEAREKRTHPPDFVFPQQQPNEGWVAVRDWAPTFGDYLYVSVTASTAFSPTDTMPYTKRAKLLMGLQNMTSLAIVAMLIARAVGIAGG